MLNKLYAKLLLLVQPLLSLLLSPLHRAISADSVLRWNLNWFKKTKQTFLMHSIPSSLGTLTGRFHSVSLSKPTLTGLLKVASQMQWVNSYIVFMPDASVTAWVNCDVKTSPTDLSWFHLPRPPGRRGILTIFHKLALKCYGFTLGIIISFEVISFLI